MVSARSSAWEAEFSKYYQWRTFHFVIYSPSQDITHRIANDIEKIYDKVAGDLGYDFYRIKKEKIPIYIFKTRWDYVKKRNMPLWSGGCADSREVEIFSFPHKELIRSTIPHELTHLLFNTYMGLGDNLNRLGWLSEGLSVYEQRHFEKIKVNSQSVKRAVCAGKYIPFQKLLLFKTWHDMEPGKVSDYYRTASSLVAYLLEVKGKTNFQDFCEKLKEGKGIEYALSQAYPWDFTNVDELEDKWLAYMGADKIKRDIVASSPAKKSITAEFVKASSSGGSGKGIDVPDIKGKVQTGGVRHRIKGLKQTIKSIALKLEDVGARLDEKIRNINMGFFREKDKSEPKEDGKGEEDGI